MTPGPWKWDPEGTRGYPVLYGGKDGGYAVLGLPGDRSYLTLDDPDAHLISAAPDLLHALKGFVDEECHCGNEGVVKPCVQCVARRAIAKAEGRES